MPLSGPHLNKTVSHTNTHLNRRSSFNVGFNKMQESDLSHRLKVYLFIIIIFLDDSL